MNTFVNKEYSDFRFYFNQFYVIFLINRISFANVDQRTPTTKDLVLIGGI